VEKRRETEEWVSKAHAAAERAVALEPNLPAGYSSLGLTSAVRGQFMQAEELLSQALKLDPFYPEALHSYSLVLGAAGRIDEALAVKQRLLNMEPFVVVYRGGVPDLLWANGQTDAAAALLKEQNRPIDLPHIAALHWTQGRRNEANDVLMKIPPGVYPDGMVETTLRFLRNGARDMEAARSLPRLSHRLDFAYFPAGVPERTLERFEDDVAAGYLTPNLFLAVWTPLYAPVRQTERFKTLVRDAGLVEYWRAKGWPSFCRPTDADDFVCN
jgi:tetratricopeptide (TPR) repeat protein